MKCLAQQTAINVNFCDCCNYFFSYHNNSSGFFNSHLNEKLASMTLLTKKAPQILMIKTKCLSTYGQQMKTCLFYNTMSTILLPFWAVRVTGHPLGSDMTSHLLNHWSLGGHASAEHCSPTHPVAFSESGWTPVSWWVMTSSWAFRASSKTCTGLSPLPLPIIPTRMPRQSDAARSVS